MRIGITGQSGFIGSHLYNTLGIFLDEFQRIDFEDVFFQNQEMMDRFVSQCDVIVHLAAVNRHQDGQVLYQTNIDLTKKLINSLERTKSVPHLLISSSIQEERDSLYGKSKREARQMLAQWAERSNAQMTGLIIPNVFGAFGKPFYNSFIATFCYQLTHNQTPRVEVDGEVQLIYVKELVDEIIERIRSAKGKYEYFVKPTSVKKVSEVLVLLNYYKQTYFEKGEIPNIGNLFERNLFNTFRSYISYDSHFPIEFVQHTDDRGTFVEIIRLGVGGQCSFSTTKPSVIRGNHYHTRKIERFAVIKGKAIVRLRKIGSDKIFQFFMNGEKPAYIDIPIWFTHSIENVGDEDLYTIFWIDEPYNPEDADTYFEGV